jgi:hypothetical protein
MQDNKEHQSIRLSAFPFAEAKIKENLQIAGGFNTRNQSTDFNRIVIISVLINNQSNITENRVGQ